MGGSVVQHGLHAHHRVCRHGSLHHGLLQPLVHCGIEVLRHRAAHHFLGELISLLQVVRGAEAHLDMAVLAVAAGLLLIFILHIGLLADGLPVRHLGPGQLHVHLVLVQQTADHDVQMLVAHAVEQGLAVLRVVDHLQGQVFLGHLLQGLGNLVHVALVLGFIAHIGVRRGHVQLAVLNRGGLGGKAVACPGIAELGQRAQIPRVELRHLRGLVALHHVELAHLLLHLGVHIVEQVVRLQHAGIHLDQGVLADEGIHDGLPDIGRLRLGEVIVRIVDFVGLLVDAGDLAVLGAGHVFHDIVQQRVHALAQDVGAHGHGNDAAVAHIGAQGRPDFSVRESLAAEVPLHHLLAGLGHGLHQRIAAQLQIRLVVLGDLAVHHFLALPAVSCLGDYVHVAYEFLAFADGQVEGRHLLAVEVCHVLHHLAEGSVVHVHVGHIDEPGQLVLLAQLPCLLGAHLDAGFAVHHDDGRACGADGLLGLAHEIEITGGIYHVNLVPFPLDGDNGGVDGELALLLFLAVVAQGVAVGYLAHSGCDAGQIRKGLCQTGLAASAVAQQYDIANLVSCVDFHLTFLQFLCNFGYFDMMMISDSNPMNPFY